MIDKIGNISKKIENERFSERVRILYYARIFILLISISVIVIPALRLKFNVHGVVPYLVFIIMVSYSTINYYIKPIKLLRVFTYLTLTFDNLALMIVIVYTGGFQSPLLTTQIVYLIFFTTLFPKPFHILPPLLMLPIIARIDLILDQESPALENIFTIIWLSALNLIIIYFLVLLENKIHQNAMKIYQYQTELKEKSILEEKNKIARDLHDGVGGALSSLIIQSEYILSLVNENEVDSELISELKELKYYAEESMDEIRRSLNVIKNNFEFEKAVNDFVAFFEERNRVKTETLKTRFGKINLSHKDQLSLFRVFQEIMNNSLKHSGCDIISYEIIIDIEKIYIEVSDKGKGFNPDKNYPGHYGLKNLKERINLLHGEIDLKSVLNEGTNIKISVPNTIIEHGVEAEWYS
ncbi:hypothetical protein JXR93_09910 [bacterium]|nr:hypothetical protein [bacterium]